MFEQKFANLPPVSYGGTAYGGGHPYAIPTPPHVYGDPRAYSNYTGTASFSPNQYAPATPSTVNSANPFFSPYGESPVTSPGSVPPFESVYDSDGRLLNRQPSQGAASYLSRQPSAAGHVANTSVSSSDAHYVDLSRSSVTPFQAAQYAEISARLNSDLPPIVDSPISEEHDIPDVPAKDVTRPLDVVQSIEFQDHARLSVQPTPRENSLPESPFADPIMQEFSADNKRVSLLFDGSTPVRESFLQPPSPSLSSKSRVPSSPPILPEIYIQERSFSPVSYEFPLVPSSVKPSPLASSFALPSPPPEAHFMGASPDTPTTTRAKDTPAAKRPDTVYTLYDDEDAYAGI